MYFLYNALLAAAMVLSLPFWLWKMLRVGKYRTGLAERLGLVPKRMVRGDGQAIWIHAVSVGEVIAVTGLVEELRRRHPRVEVFISTTTATGQKIARSRFGAERVFFFPLDFGFAIHRWLKVLRPSLVVMAETEFWPNFLRLAKASGAKVAVVNARISDRSLPGYMRWRRWLRPVLGTVDFFLAQSVTDAARLVAIGAPAERVQVSGNLKFDAQPPSARGFAEALRTRFLAAEASPVLVCGSTTAAPDNVAGNNAANVAVNFANTIPKNEEQILLAAFAEVLREFPAAVMILAPRHPERFAEVAAMIAATAFRFWRRSHLEPDAILRGGVLLLDSVGELAAVYSYATIAFVGGSLVARGGHNILEPAHFGIPIIVGPHTENFRDIVMLFEMNDAVRVVGKTSDGGNADFNSVDAIAKKLAEVWLNLLRDGTLAELGLRGQQTLRQHRGATARTVLALEALAGLKAVSQTQSTELQGVAE